MLTPEPFAAPLREPNTVDDWQATGMPLPAFTRSGGRQRTNYGAQQTSYRNHAAFFFACRPNYERLERLVPVINIVSFFVKEFERGQVVRTRKGTIHCIIDEYRAALANHKKRYYNFESKAGHGDLWWFGSCNPPVEVNPWLGNAALPLPQLVALQWFIQFDFDPLFWDNFKAIEEAFRGFSTAIKRRYTETHKAKKKALRARIEKYVIEKRGEHDEVSSQGSRGSRTSSDNDRQGEGGSASGRRGVYLTRKERQEVARLLSEEQKRARAEKRAAKRLRKGPSLLSARKSQQQRAIGAPSKIFPCPVAPAAVRGPALPTSSIDGLSQRSAGSESDATTLSSCSTPASSPPASPPAEPTDFAQGVSETFREWYSTGASSARRQERRERFAAPIVATQLGGEPITLA